MVKYIKFIWFWIAVFFFTAFPVFAIILDVFIFLICHGMAFIISYFIIFFLAFFKVV